MSYVVLMIAHAVDFYCDILLIALILRMILSLFDPEGEGLILGFTDFLVRPVLIISDKILALLKIGNSGPIDFSPMIAYMLILILQSFISPFLF
ncbi:MAG: YggT family protein [Clostridia bacterium]|nr:YggT family protein [Clostridia bacterium]